MATKKKELLEQDAPVTETVMSESETLLVDTAQPESLPADAGDGLDLNELLGLMDQPQQDTSGEDMNEDPLPELTEEEMFGDAPAETGLVVRSAIFTPTSASAMCSAAITRS